jgi:hypothetical protein
LYLREVLEAVKVRAAAGDPAMLVKGIAYDRARLSRVFYL